MALVNEMAGKNKADISLVPSKFIRPPRTDI